jgi:hypothetical protein
VRRADCALAKRIASTSQPMSDGVVGCG